MNVPNHIAIILDGNGRWAKKLSLIHIQMCIRDRYTSCAIPEELFVAIKEIVPPAEMEVVMFAPEKQVREERIRNLKDKLAECFADKEDWLPLIDEAVYQYEKKTVRKMILKDHKRPDGRETVSYTHLYSSSRYIIN